MAISKIGTNALDQSSLELGASGNVGIGNTSPATKLEVTGDIGGTWATGATRFVGSQYLTGSSYQLGMKTTMDTRETQIFAKAADTGGYVTVATGTTPTERMRIDSSGNVGIGTSSPGTNAKLDVIGNINIDSAFSSQYGLCFRRGFESSDNLKIYAGDTGLGRTGGLRLTAYDGIAFGTGSNTWQERMRIDSSGNLLVGTTATSVGERLRVVGSDNVFVSQCANSNHAIVTTNTSGTANYYAAIFCNNGTSFSGRGDITVSATTVSYNSYSDYRLKENIAPMTGALAKVAELKPCTYTWKESGIDGQGFIAHELQAVVPDCVTGEKDAVDADGNPVYQGIDTSFLVATLTAAIQELKAEFDEYKRTHP